MTQVNYHKLKFYSAQTIACLLFLLPNFGALAQKRHPLFEAGDAYFYWGWNRSAYTRTDLRFKGDGYDFRLDNVAAHDRPTLPISPKRYIVHFFTPQNDYKFGYFIKNDLGLSFGVDHMKYVMDQDQVVHMKGNVYKEGVYKGYHDGPQKLTADFLTFEHTNGLNYVNLEIEKFYPFYQSGSGKVKLGFMIGGGIGALVPKTDVRLLGYAENDRFHLSGFGVSEKAGITARFFHNIMWRLDQKVGYINMPDIVVTQKTVNGRAKQQFFFGEVETTFGYVRNISGKKRRAIKVN